MTTQEKINKNLARILADRMWFIEQELVAGQDVRDVLLNGKDELENELLPLIESAKREVLEEMRPANATIESMRIYTPRTHTYMGKEYPACSICGFCPEAMNAFIDAQLEQSEESI